MVTQLGGLSYVVTGLGGLMIFGYRTWGAYHLWLQDEGGFIICGYRIRGAYHLWLLD